MRGSGVTVRLLNTGMAQPADRRRRFWLEPARPIRIGTHAYLWFEVDRDDETYTVRAIIRQYPVCSVFHREDTVTVGPRTWLDISGYCGVMAIPRALELDAVERPRRVLMEFVTVGDSFEWTAPA